MRHQPLPAYDIRIAPPAFRKRGRGDWEVRFASGHFARGDAGLLIRLAAMRHVKRMA